MLQIKAKDKCFQELYTVVSCGNNVLPRLLYVQLHQKWAGLSARARILTTQRETKEKMEGKGRERKRRKWGRWWDRYNILERTRKRKKETTPKEGRKETHTEIPGPSCGGRKRQSLGSRGRGKCSKCILGDAEQLTIYNSVLSSWIDTGLAGSQEADVHHDFSKPAGQIWSQQLRCNECLVHMP